MFREIGESPGQVQSRRETFTRGSTIRRTRPVLWAIWWPSRLLCGAVLLLLVSACISGANAPPPAALPILFEKTLPQQSIAHLSLSPDGKRLLVGGAFQHLRILKTDDSAQATATLDTEGEIIAARFVGTEPAVLLANNLGRVQIWEQDLRQLRFEYLFPTPSRLATADSQGRFIAYGGQFLDRTRRRLVAEPVFHASQSAIGIGGSWALTAGFHDASVDLRDTRTGTVSRWSAPSPVSTAAIDREGRRIVAATAGGEIFLLACPSFEELGRASLAGGATLVAVGPDGGWFAFAGPSRFELLSTDSLRPLGGLPLPAPAHALAVSEDGRWIAVGTDDGTVQVWDAAGSGIAARQRVGDSPVTALSLGSAANLLAAGTDEGRLVLYRFSGTKR